MWRRCNKFQTPKRLRYQNNHTEPLSENQNNEYKMQIKKSSPTSFRIIDFFLALTIVLIIKMLKIIGDNPKAYTKKILVSLSTFEADWGRFPISRGCPK